MKNHIAAIAALAALVACGDGNPFGAGDGGDAVVDDDDTTSTIPEDVAGDLDGFSFDAGSGQLLITGITLDDEPDVEPTTVEYNRQPVLDVPGYLAYSIQEDPLDQHVTAYAQAIGQVTGVMAVSGGQFTYYNGGTRYSRSGSYDPQDVTNNTGLTTYAGNYVGLSNVNGPNTDLLPTAVGTDPSVLPTQASQVQGNIFINVDYADESLKGVVYNRVATTLTGGQEVLPDLVLVPTELSTDGTFAGDVELGGSRQNVGEYGGIIGGPDGEAMAGGLIATEHFEDNRSGEQEYGLWVLGRCGTAVETSALCNQVDE